MSVEVSVARLLEGRASKPAPREGIASSSPTGARGAKLAVFGIKLALLSGAAIDPISENPSKIRRLSAGILGKSRLIRG
jgi:hypothetical protein